MGEQGSKTADGVMITGNKKAANLSAWTLSSTHSSSFVLSSGLPTPARRAPGPQIAPGRYDLVAVV